MECGGLSAVSRRVPVFEVKGGMMSIRIPIMSVVRVKAAMLWLARCARQGDHVLICLFAIEEEEEEQEEEEEEEEDEEAEEEKKENKKKNRTKTKRKTHKKKTKKKAKQQQTMNRKHGKQTTNTTRRVTRRRTRERWNGRRAARRNTVKAACDLTQQKQYEREQMQRNTYHFCRNAFPLASVDLNVWII